VRHDAGDVGSELQVLELNLRGPGAEGALPERLRWLARPGRRPREGCFVPAGLFSLGLTLLGLAFTLPMGVACVLSPVVLFRADLPVPARVGQGALGLAVAAVCWVFNLVLLRNLVDHLRYALGRGRVGLHLVDDALLDVRPGGQAWVLPLSLVARIERRSIVSRRTRHGVRRKHRLDVVTRDGRTFTTTLDPSLVATLSLGRLERRRVALGCDVRRAS
jgi:hypothetical protein